MIISIYFFVLLSFLITGFEVTQAAAPEELVINGDFETRNLEGWTVEGDIANAATICKERGSRIAYINGTLSQTIKIPANSKIIISFWYDMSKDNSLTELEFFIRESTGSIIQYWYLSQEIDRGNCLDWTQFKYELDPYEISKSITLEFRGTGSLRYYTVKGASIPLIYLPYVDDVSAVYQIIEKNVTTTSTSISSTASKSMLTNQSSSTTFTPTISPSQASKTITNQEVNEKSHSFTILEQWMIPILLLTIIIVIIAVFLMRKKSITRGGKHSPPLMRKQETEQIEMIKTEYCYHCGATMPKESKFCKTCGKKQT